MGIVVFLFITSVLYLYSYVLGGSASSFMLYMLFVAPGVSMLLTIPVRKSLGVTIEVPSTEVEKDGTVKMRVSVRNRTFLPVPFLDICFMESPNFILPSSTNIRISLAPFEERSIVVGYAAKRRGRSKIGVKSMALRDYLGLFSLQLLKDVDEGKRTGEITILPRVLDIKPSSQILLSSHPAYDSGDIGNPYRHFSRGIPELGYECREYAAGDSFNKVHWKLSAKNGVLMVRNDQEAGRSKKCLIQDPNTQMLGQKGFQQERFLPKDHKGRDEIEEKMIEAILSVAQASAANGTDVEVWLFEEGQWNVYQVRDGRDIDELQYRLALYQFGGNSTLNHPDPVPLPSMMQREGGQQRAPGEAVIFTHLLGNPVLEASMEFNAYGLPMDIVWMKESGGKEEAKDSEAMAPPVSLRGQLWILSPEDDLKEAFS